MKQRKLWIRGLDVQKLVSRLLSAMLCVKKKKLQYKIAAAHKVHTAAEVPVSTVLYVLRRSFEHLGAGKTKPQTWDGNGMREACLLQRGSTPIPPL